MNIYESSEDYLETILILSEQMEFVRSIDIVNTMGFSKPSVSIAMKKLEVAGYIIFGKHNHIELTEEGYKVAKKVYERHVILSEALEKMGVPSEVAKADACKIEHHISDESFSAIKKYLNK